MARFARLNDPDPRVAGRLQAQLYYNRKDNRNKRINSLGPNLFTFVTPSITNIGGSTGVFNSSLKTLSNTTVGSNDSYPRFNFPVSRILIGEVYQVAGMISGDLTKISQIRLATAGVANSINFDPSNGRIFGEATAAAKSIEFVTNGTFLFSIVIEDLSIRKVP